MTDDLEFYKQSNHANLEMSSSKNNEEEPTEEQEELEYRNTKNEKNLEETRTESRMERKLTGICCRLPCSKPPNEIRQETQVKLRDERQQKQI